MMTVKEPCRVFAGGGYCTTSFIPRIQFHYSMVVVGELVCGGHEPSNIISNWYLVLSTHLYLTSLSLPLNRESERSETVLTRLANCRVVAVDALRRKPFPHCLGLR